MPSPRQDLLLKLFNYAVFLFVGIIILEIIYLSFDLSLGDFEYLLDWFALALLVIVLVLFALNFGLVRKLFLQARLRRELHLQQRLRSIFKLARWKHRLTLSISFLGYLVFLAGLFILVLAIAFDASLELFAFPVAIIALGLSFTSLHFMKRGRERLDVVRHLHDALSVLEKSVGEVSDQPVSIDAEQYDQIARIERSHIIADRLRSIAAGSKEAPTSGYMIQQSHEMIVDKVKLDSHTRLLVEDQILKLTGDPMSTVPMVNSDNERFQISVPDTDIVLLYQVDQKNRRIRVLSLRSAGPDHPYEQPPEE